MDEELAEARTPSLDLRLRMENTKCLHPNQTKLLTFKCSALTYAVKRLARAFPWDTGS